jgi:hypothetical protein
MSAKNKINYRRSWINWYASGAITQPRFPGEALAIMAVAESFVGPSVGLLTLSIGEQLVNSGPGWKITKPLCAVLVPECDRAKYEFRSTLKRLPGNAIPVEVFYSESE